LDERAERDVERWVQSACVLCSNGCGVDIGVREGKIVGVRGRESDRVNRGRLGPKGLHGWEANDSPDRLQRPLIRKCVSFAKKAESHVAKLASSIERYGAQNGAGSQVQARDGDDIGLLAVLRTLFLAAEEVSITWVMADQAAQAARDTELLAVVHECHAEVELQAKWLTTRIKVAAPQALVTV
jgi:NADH dehydrogenase/NADH:ubiquinone oxidoreductase subunit G